MIRRTMIRLILAALRAGSLAAALPTDTRIGSFEVPAQTRDWRSPDIKAAAASKLARVGGTEKSDDKIVMQSLKGLKEGNRKA